ncbi:MAG: hypothetical protein AAGN66_16405 [Acidobacteriota bacterium]
MSEAGRRFSYRRDEEGSRGTLDDRYVWASAEFFSPDLDDVVPPRFETPPVVGELVNQLRANHILVLGGHGLSEKVAFARHLAWFLGEEMGLEVLQWHPSTNAQRLEDTFERQRGDRVVYVFPDLRPHHFDFDLHRLQAVVQRSGHFAIVATDSLRNDWAWGEGFPCWRDLDDGAVFPEEYLVSSLRHRLGLSAAEGYLPEGFLPDGADGWSEVVAGGPSLRIVARRLGTPIRIQSFLTAVTADGARGEVPWLEEQLAQLAGDNRAIRKWYFGLSKRQQVLALGLAMFDGLFEDQVFAALEILVGSEWRGRDPVLAQFDYHELVPLTAYFQGVEGRVGTVGRVGVRVAATRLTLLEAAWGLHRRLVLQTLPFLARLVRESAGVSPWMGAGSAPSPEPGEGGGDSAPEPEDPESARTSRWGPRGRWSELFGSPHRRNRLRQTISELLSLLGRLSMDVAEHTLLELAQSSDREVQAVAASTMARWRDGDDGGPRLEATLYRKLSEWLDEAAFQEFAQRRYDPQHPNPDHAHMRATVALTVSYAGLLDPPGGLNPQLKDLLDKLVDDDNAVVRTRFESHTLPRLVAHHAGELETWLEGRVLVLPALVRSLGVGLGSAVDARPGSATELLERWFRRSTDAPADGSLRDHEVTVRETRFGAVLRAYSWIDLPGDDPASRSAGEGAATLTETGLLRRIGNVLEVERHPFVRSAAVDALLGRVHRLAQDDATATLGSDLRSAVDGIALDERRKLVDGFVRAYLEQRRRQPGGIDRLVIEGVSYPTWLAEERPRTDVETLVFDWLEDGLYPVAQQLALGVLTAWEGSKLVVIERKEAERRSRPEAEPVSRVVHRSEPRRFHGATGPQRLAISLAVPKVFDRRKATEGLLPEMLALRRLGHHGTVSRVLWDWRRKAVGPKPADLDKAASLHSNGCVYLILGILLLGLLAVTLAAFWPETAGGAT